jgi:hypothetical protein
MGQVGPLGRLWTARPPRSTSGAKVSAKPNIRHAGRSRGHGQHQTMSAALSGRGWHGYRPKPPGYHHDANCMRAAKGAKLSH